MKPYNPKTAIFGAAFVGAAMWVVIVMMMIQAARGLGWL